MKIKDLRAKTKNELKDLIIHSKRELMHLRFQRSAGQLSSASQFREGKRTIARIKTLIRYEQLKEERK